VIIQELFLFFDKNFSISRKKFKKIKNSPIFGSYFALFIKNSSRIF